MILNNFAGNFQDEHAAVAEAAVVGFPHEIKGEGVYAYIILKENADIDEETLKAELKVMVKNKISGFAVPDYMQVKHQENLTAFLSVESDTFLLFWGFWSKENARTLR